MTLNLASVDIVYYYRQNSLKNDSQYTPVGYCAYLSGNLFLSIRKYDISCHLTEAVKLLSVSFIRIE